MSTHYFIGVKVPRIVGRSIIEARKATNMHETHKTLPLLEDLHITLAYLAAVDDHVLTNLIQSLKEIKWEAFTLTTARLAHFGSAKTPRVVYVAVNENEELQRLQHKVVQKVLEYIELNVSKDFHAHITVAKKWKSNEICQYDSFNLETQSFEVRDFIIYKINPASTPRYEEFASINV
ncbi:MAG: RNA 2',3'-cyclic phosphodiesterase [Psychrobacillus sp.]